MMSGSPKIGVRPKITLTPRINVLTTAISEYVTAFGAPSSCNESIKKGVLERQIIEKIFIKYYSPTEFVGRVTLEIDWQTHRILLNDSEGKNFKLRSDCSIINQLEGATDEIIKHVNRMRRECGVTRIECSYVYVDEYRNDPQKHKEARDFLNHCPSDSTSSLESSDKFKTSIKLILGKLKELSITADY